MTDHSLEYRIRQGTDDAHENLGSCSTTNVGLASVGSATFYVGLRFVDVRIPQGATIVSASVEMVVGESTKNDAEGAWYAEDVDDAPAFVAGANGLSGLTLTTASVAWTTNDLGTTGQGFTTPDLASIIQEVVDRPGWESGNALALIYDHASAVENLNLRSYEQDPADAARLNIVYAAAALPSEFVMPDPVVELAFGADLDASPLSWEWTDVTGDLLAQTLNIQRGTADEAAQTQPMTVSFELSNLEGDYTPGLATSQYYPNVVRGTPCRVRLTGGSTDTYLALDGRPETNASTPDTAALDITGDMAVWFDGDIDWSRAGSTVLVSKYKAEGDQRSYALYFSKESIPVLIWSDDGTTGGWGFGFTEAPLPWSKGRHAIGATLDADNGSGGFTVTFYTADTAAGPWTTFETYVDDSGTTSIFSGTAPLEIGGDFEGDVPEFSTPHPPAGKVYSAGVDNAATLPAASPVANPDFSAESAGTTSFTDGAGLTWTLNGDAVITDLDRVRFVGHVDEIAPEWPYGDLSDGDVDSIPGEARVTITASGALRRMQQGAKPFDSPIRRVIMGDEIEGVAHADAITAYWPMEDGSDAKSFASPIPGVRPMSFSNMTPAGDDTLAASLTAANVAASQAAGFSATVPDNGQTDEWMVSFFVKMPVGTAGDTLLMQVVTHSGTVRTWRIYVSTTAFTVKGYNAAETEIVNTSAGGGPVGFFDGWNQVNLRAIQNGGNIDWSATWITLDGFIGEATASEPGTNGPVKLLQWLVSSSGTGGMSYAHTIASRGIGAGFLGWVDGANQAYLGERAGLRILRLCREEGIDCHVVGSAFYENALLGVQGTETLPDLLREAVEADGGRLFENRERPGLVYRTRASLYNQTPALELDAGQNEIAPPFVPTLDDQRLRNDVTVKRDGGTSYRATTDPEPAPGDRYDEEVTLSLSSDAQAMDQAGWRLHLGTWPGMRYRQLATELSIVRPATLAAWLALDIGDRVHVDNLPPQHPADTVDLLAEGYAERLSVSRWSPELTCSPGGPWDVGIREDADEPARYDTAGSSLAGPVGSALDLGALGNASTADKASLRMTATFGVAIDFRLDTWGANIQTLVARFETAGNLRSYMMQVNASDQPRFITSPDGTLASQVIMTCPTAITVPGSGRISVLGVFVGNDGGGNRAAAWYVGPSVDGPWTLLDDLTTAGTTSILAGTADLEVGAYDGGTVETLEGEVWAMKLYDTADLTDLVVEADLVASPSFVDQAAAASSFVDAQANTWTPGGTAAIADFSTELNVATDLGPIWTTEGADLPLDVDVAGERVTVSAISAGPSPQEFTVTRSVNGVEKAQVSGAPVSLWHPAIRAL